VRYGLLLQAEVRERTIAVPIEDEPLHFAVAEVENDRCTLGAKRAGLRSAWVERRERVPVRVGPEPDFEAPDLAAAARQLAA
jgi:hypothetical protein